MILQFLVPVKLLLGVMPSPQLIDAYALHEYTGLTDAIRCGNLRLFNEYLDKYQEQFIQQGVYLLIEKLRLVVMRNLIKKVYVSCLLAWISRFQLCLLATPVAMSLTPLTLSAGLM